MTPRLDPFMTPSPFWFTKPIPIHPAFFLSPSQFRTYHLAFASYSPVDLICFIPFCFRVHPRFRLAPFETFIMIAPYPNVNLTSILSTPGKSVCSFTSLVVLWIFLVFAQLPFHPFTLGGSLNKERFTHRFFHKFNVHIPFTASTSPFTFMTIILPPRYYFTESFNRLQAWCSPHNDLEPKRLSTSLSTSAIRSTPHFYRPKGVSFPLLPIRQAQFYSLQTLGPHIRPQTLCSPKEIHANLNNV